MEFYEYDPLMFPVTDDENEKHRPIDNEFEIDPDEGFDREEDDYYE